MHVPLRDHSMKVNVISFVFVLDCIQNNACVGQLCYADASLHAAMTFERV